MHFLRRVEGVILTTCLGLVVVGILALGMTSCTPTHFPTRLTQGSLDPGWPQGKELWSETPTAVESAGWAEQQQYWPSVPYLAVPKIADTESLAMDELCETCHETYAQKFANNVHREQGCEKCHGGASLHLETRGKEPNTILSLRSSEVGTQAGKLVSPAERSEVCLQCHEKCEPQQQDDCLAVPTWRISAHAHKGVACTDCHRAHYLVPPGTPAVEEVEETAWAAPDGQPQMRRLSYQESPFVEESPRGKSNNLAAVSPVVCYRCHQEKIRMEQVAHPHQLGIPLNFPCTTCHNPAPSGLPHDVKGHPQYFDCTTCHNSHGNITRKTKKDLCLKCHNGPHMDEWHGSPHDAAGLTCTDCHDPHSETGPPMHVDQPQTCYRCHPEMGDLSEIAHPHQILGPNGFNCTTCHRPHGKVVMATRRDHCLECHDGAPSMAWHSSTHNREGVACTDCHNPHPRAEVPQMVNISHTTVKRRKRLPMSVDEPEVCYKCHQKIYGLTALPSRHPIAEGKMVCSDCHDSHGQAKGNLKEATVNEVCYECHAEKEGPFAYEHAPATENCAYCHEPHGTVANNLLRQPTTFLCLRCHSGHSTHGASEQCLRCHFVDGDTTNVGGGPLDPTIPTTPALRKALFTDCTQCHSQVHGSDLPSGFECFGMMQR